MKKIVFALVVLVGFTTAGYSQTPDGSNGNKGLPGMSFKADKHDFKIIKKNVPVTCTFVVTNDGTEPVIFSGSSPTGGGTWPELTKEALRPG